MLSCYLFSHHCGFLQRASNLWQKTTLTIAPFHFGQRKFLICLKVVQKETYYILRGQLLPSLNKPNVRAGSVTASLSSCSSCSRGLILCNCQHRGHENIHINTYECHVKFFKAIITGTQRQGQTEVSIDSPHDNFVVHHSNWFRIFDKIIYLTKIEKKTMLKSFLETTPSEEEEM